MDLAAGQCGPANVYAKPPDAASLYKSDIGVGARVTAGADAAPGNGLFPFQAAAYTETTITDLVVATVVSMGQFEQMLNQNSAAGTNWASANWEKANFAIVPLRSADAVQTPEYVSMQTMTWLAFPFVHATQGFSNGRIDSGGTDYPTTNITSEPYLNWTHSAWQSPISGPHFPGDGTALYILYVITDVGALNGGTNAVDITVGTEDNNQVLTMADTLVETSIAAQLYDFHLNTADGLGAIRARMAQRVMDEILVRYASEACVKAALGWWTGVVPRVGNCFYVTNSSSIKGGRYQYVSTSSSGTPVWDDTNFTQASTQAAVGALITATVPLGMRTVTTPPANVTTDANVTALLEERYAPVAILPGREVMSNLLLSGGLLVPINKPHAGLTHQTARSLRHLAIWGGSCVASAVDLYLEKVGVPSDIFFGLNALTRSRFTAWTDDWCGLVKDKAALKPIYVPSSDEPTFITPDANHAFPARRVPVWIHHAQYMPSSREPIGTKARAIGANGGTRYALLEDVGGLEKPWKTMIQTRAIGSTGRLSSTAGVPSIAYFIQSDWSTFIRPTACWQPTELTQAMLTFLGWDAWGTRSVDISQSVPLLAMHPRMNFYSASTNIIRALGMIIDWADRSWLALGEARMSGYVLPIPVNYAMPPEVSYAGYSGILQASEIGFRWDEEKHKAELIAEESFRDDVAVEGTEQSSADA
jgi:hypothetical protein